MSLIVEIVAVICSFEYYNLIFHTSKKPGTCNHIEILLDALLRVCNFRFVDQVLYTDKKYDPLF